MMWGVNVTFIITGLAYFLVAIMGFWAFGTGVADNVLLTFSKGPHSWVVAMAGMGPSCLALLASPLLPAARHDT